MNILKGIYQLKVTGAEAKETKEEKKPMWALDLEFANNGEKKDKEGNAVEVDGKTAKVWLVLADNETNYQAAGKMLAYNEVELPETKDETREQYKELADSFVNCEFLCLVNSRSEEVKDELGEVIVDPEGNAITEDFVQLDTRNLWPVNR